MGVFDDDKIRCSPADCLLLPRTHLLEVAKKCTHTRMQPHAHMATPFFIVEELLALQGLKLQQQLILVTPCKPWRLCRESEPPCVHRGDGSSPSATLPSTSTTHIHSHLQLILLCRQASSAEGLAPPGGQTYVAPSARLWPLMQFARSVSKMVEAKC